MPSPEIDRIIERVARNVEFLQEHDSNFECGDLPALQRPSSFDETEARAAQARELLGLDQTQPLLDASSVGNKVGLLAFLFDLGQGLDTADAASILLERGAIVLVNGYLQSGRRRLALIHEWGHCLFADEYSIDWRIAENADSQEWEARIDHFARALLLPADGIARWWGNAAEDGKNLRTTSVLLGSQFRVNMSTLARRLLSSGTLVRRKQPTYALSGQRGPT